MWRWFDLVNEIIGGDEDTLAEVAEGFVAQQAAERVGYTEVRWDPVRPAVSHLANASISVEAAVRAVERGLRAGAERHGIEVHQLLCAMRGSPGAACFDLARLAAATRSGELGGVVGIDLAGDEYHFNNSKGHVVECFRYAKGELLLNTTVHAGEMAGPDDVRSAIEDMEADRVGQYANAAFRAGTHGPQLHSPDLPLTRVASRPTPEQRLRGDAGRLRARATAPHADPPRGVPRRPPPMLNMSRLNWPS